MHKTIIVTGASRGIGQAITKFILQHGHNVVLLARSRAPLEEFRKEFPEQVRVLSGDMADFSLCQRAAELANREFGQIDGIVVNHAMLGPVTRIGNAKVEEWQNAFDVNLFSAIELTKQSLPSLRKSKGCIIMTSSGAAEHSYSTWGAYGATKAAMNSLCRTIAVEEPDVTVLSIAPGVVDTEMQREIRDLYSSSMNPQDSAKFHTLHKEGGLLRPEQPGNIMAKLVLDAPTHLSGEFLRWNDGKLMAYHQE